MSMTRKLAFATALALGIAGAAALPVLADTHGWRGHAGGPGQHIDGRIAFLKAELKITGDEAAQWNAVADAMRANSQAMGKLFEEARANRDKPLTAPERLDWRQRFAEARAQAAERFAAAFKPLYDRMSDDQRKAADALLQPHHRRG
jgi:Spy/CpxP family protein refolding chaperone